MTNEKTDNEIVTRMNQVTDSDWLGTIRGDLVEYLPFSSAQKFLNPDIKKGEWEKEYPFQKDKNSILNQMKFYMDFAWNKANNNRGISAGRSIDHMSAWLWMIGEDKVADQLADYTHYGKPQLRAICEKYGWDWEILDDDRWINEECSEGVTASAVAPVNLNWND